MFNHNNIIFLWFLSKKVQINLTKQQTCDIIDL